MEKEVFTDGIKDLAFHYDLKLSKDKLLFLYTKLKHLDDKSFKRGIKQITEDIEYIRPGTNLCLLIKRSSHQEGPGGVVL